MEPDKTRRSEQPADLPDCSKQYKAAHQQTLIAIRQGILSAERGELKDAAQVYAEMKARYGIQG